MSRTITFAALAAVVCSVLAAQGRKPAKTKKDKDLVTWRQEDRPRAEVAGSDPGVRALLEAWGPYAAANDYRLVLDDDRRLLLVLSGNHARLKSGKERHQVKSYLDLAAKTNALCDALLGRPKEPRPPLLMICARHADYAKILARLGKLHPDLADWARGAGRTVAGFVLSEPQMTCWIDDPKGVTEWHPYNELVHRLAQLRIRRETPHLPGWLLLGLAWHVEDGVRRSVYCFPHRSGFVSAGSHTDWGLWLANHFKKRSRKKQKKPENLLPGEFLDWNPGKTSGFDSGKAYLSFGVARYLAMNHLKELRTLAGKLSAATEKGQKVWVSDKEWKLNPDFLLSVDVQDAMLREVEKDYAEAMTRWFRKRKANARIPVPGRRP